MTGTAPARYGFALCLAATFASGCTSWAPEVKTWGSMREVLREGDARGRVDVVEAVGRNSLAVGALAGLEGEITVVEGIATVALGRSGEIRPARAGDEAALFVLADVPSWRKVALAEGSHDLDSLEDAIAAALERAGFDLALPIPVRVRGLARHVSCHVIAGACPIARPEGPAPRRSEETDVEVELVGVFAEGRAGELTHHTNRSHLHVLGKGMMGHLDAIELTNAVLLIPTGE